MYFTQTANLSGVLVDSLPNVAIHNDHGVESSRADCIVPIGYMSRDERQLTQSTHNHPSVNSGGVPQDTLEGRGTN